MDLSGQPANTSAGTSNGSGFFRFSGAGISASAPVPASLNPKQID
jgi:hypothetical protein